MSVLLSLNFQKYKQEGEEQLIKSKDVLLNDDEYLDIMQIMQTGLSETYHKYTNPKLKLMSFEEFIRFCGDHDIFPSYTNKA